MTQSHAEPARRAVLTVDCRCTTGEGILWCRRRAALFWTDIPAAQLWMHRLGGITRSWSLPDRLGCLGLCESGEFLLGSAKGLYAVDIDIDADQLPALRLLAPVEADEPRTRVNDGRCDRAGNFVFGTKNDAAARDPIGGFYQYSARHGLRRLQLGGAVIPNSLCFSLDGRTLYYCDSVHPRILCCDYDAQTAGVANLRTFATMQDEGSPDGSIVDAEDCLWNAQWGAARVVRYTPRGEIERVIEVPAKNPSCPAFGGTNLDRLFITTAREGLSDAELRRMPASGGVYHWQEPGLRGVPESLVRLA